MQRARAFLFVCAGIFLLALAYHFGARSAQAQAPSNPVVATFGNYPWVVTADGDVYTSDNAYGPSTLRSSVFSGGPTPVMQDTLGSLKVRYRGERGAAQPAPQGR